MSKENNTDNQGSHQGTLLKIGEREFDISTPDGLLQAQTWGEALAYTVGKQGNELGSLRKFKTERESAKDLDEMLAKVRALREEGEHEAADRLIVAHTEERELAFKEQLKTEQFNTEVWSEYFQSRPELVEAYDKDYIKYKASKAFDLTKLEDPFTAIDGLFEEKLKKTRKSSGSPVVQSAAGGRPATSPAPKGADDSEKVDFYQLLNEASAYKRKK